MSRLRPGIYAGLLYSVPLCVWYLAQLDPQPGNAGNEIMQQALRVFFIVQAMVIVLWAGCETQRAARPVNLAGLAMLILIPMPLLALIWLTGASAGVMLLAEGALFLTGMLLLFLGQVVMRLPLKETLQDVINRSWQFTLLLLIWMLREPTLGWMGL